MLIAGADGYGERSAHRADGAIEREFTHGEVAVETGKRTHGAENGESHREVETGAFLAHVGGGQIDRDGLIGVAEAGVGEGRFDAFAAFTDGGIRHADEHEIAGHAAAAWGRFRERAGVK